MNWLSSLNLFSKSRPAAAAASGTAAPNYTASEAAINEVCQKIIDNTYSSDHESATNLEARWDALKNKGAISPKLSKKIAEAANKLQGTISSQIITNIRDLRFQKICELLASKPSSLTADELNAYGDELDVYWQSKAGTTHDQIGSPLTHDIQIAAGHARDLYLKLSSRPPENPHLKYLNRLNFELISDRSDLSETSKDYAVAKLEFTNFWNALLRQNKGKVPEFLIGKPSRIHDVAKKLKLTQIISKLEGTQRAPSASASPSPSPSRSPLPLPAAPDSPPPMAGAGAHAGASAGVVAMSSTPPLTGSLGDAIRPIPVHPRAITPTRDIPVTLIPNHAQQLSKLLKEMTNCDISELDANTISDSLKGLTDLINCPTCLLEAGPYSLRTMCENFMTAYFRISPTEQQTLLSTKREELMFVYDLAMRGVLEKSQNLVSSVMGNRGQLTEAAQKEYETYAKFYRFGKNARPQKPHQKTALDALQHSLSAIYAMNEPKRQSILDSVPDYTTASQVMKTYDLSWYQRIRWKTCRELCQTGGVNPKELVPRLNGSYFELTAIQTPSGFQSRPFSTMEDVSLNQFTDSLKDKTERAITAIRENQTTSIEHNLRDSINALVSYCDGLSEQPTGLNLTELRKNKKLLSNLTLQLKEFGYDVRDLEENLKKLTKAETFFLTSVAQGKKTAGQSQYTISATNMLGSKEEGSARHACCFIAAYNVYDKLAGNPNDPLKALYLGLSRQQAACGEGKIDYTLGQPYPSLTYPDDALDCFSAILTPTSHVPIAQQVEKNNEADTYLKMLEELTEKKGANEKIGALYRKHDITYAITIESDGSGGETITIMDSHGFDKESGATPEFIGAFSCEFKSPKEAAHFLALRSPYVTCEGETPLQNQSKNQCEMYPVILNSTPPPEATTILQKDEEFYLREIPDADLL